MFAMSHTQVLCVSESCLVCLRFMFDLSWNHVPYVSESCLTCLRLIFDMSHTHVWYVSDSCLHIICLWLLFHMSQTHGWYAFRLMTNISKNHDSYILGLCSISLHPKYEISETHIWCVSFSGFIFLRFNFNMSIYCKISFDMFHLLIRLSQNSVWFDSD